MSLSSQQTVTDNRLIAAEELLRQLKPSAAQTELQSLSEQDFENDPLSLGLFLSLKAECLYTATNYRAAIEMGIRGEKLLAHFPENKRYGRVQLTLSRSYFFFGDMKNGEIRARDALSSFRRANDAEGQGLALNDLARITFTYCDFKATVAFLEEALSLLNGNPRKAALITANLGQTRIWIGQWSQAEADLKRSLQYFVEQNLETYEAQNLISLGILHLKKREFVQAGRFLDKAAVLVTRLEMKRDRIIHLEYAGELAYERGDFVCAKNILAEAYHQGKMLAPESTLMSQVSRRLAEVELALDNVEDAMRYAQKGLELAIQLGEKTEIALSHRAIAKIFAQRGSYSDAIDHALQAVDITRQIGDPNQMAHTLLTLGEIKIESNSDDHESIRAALDEAGRIFRKLKLEFWQAETDFQAGLFACRQGDLSRGFRKLGRAEKVFSLLDERTRTRSVHNFLHTLTDQAVALSISDENEYKVFGTLITQAEMSDLKSGMIEDALSIIIKRTKASRALVYIPDLESNQVTSSFSMTPKQVQRFVEKFQSLIGQEISQTTPTLLLDSRRDPYINSLFPDKVDIISSVVVVPMTATDQSTRYLYLDKLTENNALNPFNQSELNFAVGFSEMVAVKISEVQKIRLVEDNRRLKAQLQQQAAFPNIISRNNRMLEMLAQLRQVIDSPISITIEGETGSGKDLLARAIHYNSVRRNRRFISVNCAALPETLLESELFGYKRGAFTGADRDKSGLFEEADGGTFFLDEVADMPLSIQAKVLRLLEEKELVRLGETTPRRVDVRIISATNKDLKAQMARGLFRQDLYYRLSAMCYQLLPLRERKEDIPLLVEHFLESSGKRISPQSLSALISYDWPGNIRELENEIKKLVLLTGTNPEINRELLSGKIINATPTATSVAVSVKTEDHVSFDEHYSLYDYLAYWEKKFIVKALQEHRGIKKHAAAMLNIPESTLRLKIKQYDINIDQLDMAS